MILFFILVGILLIVIRGNLFFVSFSGMNPNIKAHTDNEAASVPL